MSALEGCAFAVESIFNVLGSILFFFRVFSELSSVVDICNEIVLFLEKLRVQRVSGRREVRHVVVIN